MGLTAPWQGRDAAPYLIKSGNAFRDAEPGFAKLASARKLALRIKSSPLLAALDLAVDFLSHLQPEPPAASGGEARRSNRGGRAN